MGLILQTILASLAAIVIENVIFTTAFGTSTPPPDIFFSRIRGHTILAAVSWARDVYKRQLSNSTLARFMPSVYILSLGFVYIFTLIAIWFISKDKFKRLKKYVHLSAFNCTVLSALFNNTLMGGTLFERILYAAQIGIGFAFAAYIFSINFEKLNSDDVPSAFAGLPVYILYIGVVSMIVYAIS